MSDQANLRPNEGDLVRMVGDPAGQVMLVTCSALGDDHLWEGVRNGILCIWLVGDQQEFEVFRPGQLEIVEAAGQSKVL